MPIYDIFETKARQHQEESTESSQPQAPQSSKDRFFSALTARVLFFILFAADLCWIAYAATLLILASTLYLVSGFRWSLVRYVMHKQWVALKRASVCAISLFIALFSPALGIMVACTYFLMYDKTGIQEVVPTSLQEQFQEFLR